MFPFMQCLQSSIVAHKICDSTVEVGASPEDNFSGIRTNVGKPVLSKNLICKCPFCSGSNFSK